MRYFGLHANAHREKVRKSEGGGHKLIMVEAVNIFYELKKK